MVVVVVVLDVDDCVAVAVPVVFAWGVEVSPCAESPDVAEHTQRPSSTISFAGGAEVVAVEVVLCVVAFAALHVQF